MTREIVVNQLKKVPCSYAMITVDVCRGGQVVYPNEKVVISVLETQDPMSFIGKSYCVFDSIKDFRKNSIFGEDEARKAYCRYYFGNISKIEYFYKKP